MDKWQGLGTLNGILFGISMVLASMKNPYWGVVFAFTAGFMFGILCALIVQSEYEKEREARETPVKKEEIMRVPAERWDNFTTSCQMILALENLWFKKYPNTIDFVRETPVSRNSRSSGEHQEDLQ